jgi:hypothetical protein
MTIERLLENLKNQLNSISSAIHAIEEIQRNEQHSVKRARIISSIRREKKKKQYIPIAPKSYNGKHWMQLPENRKKMLTQVKLMQSANERNKK